MENAIDLLESRSLLEQVTSDELRAHMEKPQTFYLGFDPTGDSLHLGHLLGVVVMRHLQKLGHRPIALVGGATGMVGDPSGKSVERNLLDAKTLAHNVACLEKQLKQLLSSDEEGFEIPVVCNNMDWLSSFSMIEFLRDVGKHFRVNIMLTKESVRQRIEQEEGISYTEFSYQLLQAYDFHYLAGKQAVSLQLGGSDQWGNIVAGIELHRKMGGEGLYGLTWPLLTRSDGKKFGKSESGAIWLDKDKLSAYDFYQYLMKIPDSDVIAFMKKLTFLPLREIEAMEKQMQAPDYVPNTAQKRFAEAVTLMCHGQEGLDEALKSTELARPGQGEVDISQLIHGDSSIPKKVLSQDQVLGVKIFELLFYSGAVESKGAGRRLIKNGGIYLNNKKVIDENKLLHQSDLVEGHWLMLSIGKKNRTLVKVEF